MWVFVDAHPDTGGDNGSPQPYDGIFSLPPGFVSMSGGTKWNDMPAAYHNKRNCGFSFADGHAEIHRWQSKSTLVPINYTYNASSSVSVPPNDSVDLMWMFLHACNSGVAN